MPRTFFVDPENGNDANDGFSFANRKRTINSAVATITAGDEVRVIANTPPVNIGVCTWNRFGTITLPAGETAGLYNDGVWGGAQAGITPSVSTTVRREGANSALLQATTTYTGTTKMASFSGLSANDLSAYSKINLWFYNQLGTTYANLSVFAIILCSDTNGNVPVYTLRFPNSVAPPPAAWVPITIDNGAPLSLATNINSITLSANRQIHTATTNVFIDNVFASKNIRLDGLISKNSTTDVDTLKPELWWGLRSVTGNIVTVDQSPSLNVQTSPSEGYYGITETVSGYALSPMAQAATTSTTTGVLNSFSTRIGTTAEPIIVGGGWDRDTMTQQISGVSWLRSTHATQYFVSQSNTRNIIYNNIGVTRCEDGFRILGTAVNTTSGVYLNNVHVVGAREFGIYCVTTSSSYALSNCSGIQCGSTDTTDGGIILGGVYNLSAINCVGVNNYGAGIAINTGSFNTYGKNLICANNDVGTSTNQAGLTLNSTNCRIENLSCINNDPYGLFVGSANKANRNTFVNSYIALNGSTTNANAGGMTVDLGTGNTFYNSIVYANSGAAGATNINGGVILTGQASDTFFYNLTTQENKVGTEIVGIRTTFPSSLDSVGDVFVKNWYPVDVLTNNKVTGWNINDSIYVYSTNESDNANSHFVYTNTGQIEGTTLSARSPGICWQMDMQKFSSTTTTFFRDESTPLVHYIRNALCTANIPTTASLWVRRTNSTISGKFLVRGFQIAGVSDVAVYTTSASLTDWEKLSIEFTPTETGFIEFEIHAFNSAPGALSAPTGILIWDDFNVTPSTTIAATSGDYGYIAQGVVVSTPISASGGSTPTPTSTEKSFVFC